ncbi:hypothetical protein M5E88_13075 [Akkermansia muciniphila]|nr:hypothetical protein M5E88_13075 [Akkermansia muciniphila]
MPTRLIRDAILTSGRVASLSWEAEVFYRRLMSVADDYGLYDARTPILRSALYPLQLDKMSECNIQRCLSACEAAGLILLYSHNEKPYLMILGFDQQGKSMPKWPLPNGYEVLKVSDKKYELRKLVTGRNDSPQPVTYANAYSETETETKTDANAKKLPVSRGIEQFPWNAEDVRLFMAAQLMAPKGDELKRCAESFLMISAPVDGGTARGFLLPIGSRQPGSMPVPGSRIMRSGDIKVRLGGMTPTREGGTNDG